MNFIKKYPISLLIVCIVAYLSLFKPPKTDLDNIPNIDKVVHICMYFGMSGMLWIEYMRSHRGSRFRWLPILLIAIIFPIAFSGCMELLQAYDTTYRTGDIRDVLANSTGVMLASAIAWFLVRPRWFS